MQKNWRSFKNNIENYLCPPSMGGPQIDALLKKQENLLEKIYGGHQQAQSLWQRSLDTFPLGPKTALLGIPTDTGSNTQKGAALGPLFMREVLFESWGEYLPIFDMGDVKVISQLLHDQDLSAQAHLKYEQYIYSKEKKEKCQRAVSPLSIAENFSHHFHRVFPGKNIFALGGDHSISYPLVKSYLIAKKKQEKKVALVHFDALLDKDLSKQGPIGLHSNNWISHLFKEQLLGKNDCFHIGVRPHKVDQEMSPLQFSSQDVENSPIKVAKDIVNQCKLQDIQELYISFDINVLGPEYASATGNPLARGVSPHAGMVILQELYEHLPITGADMVEIAPTIHTSKGLSLEPETTLMMAKSFALFLIQAMAAPKTTK